MSKDYSRLSAFLIQPSKEALEQVEVPEDLKSLPKKLLLQWKESAEKRKAEEKSGEKA